MFCIPLPSIRSISAGLWCSHTQGTLWKSEWPPCNKHVEQFFFLICAICCTTWQLMNHRTKKHATLWWGCIVCDSCSKASMTIKLRRRTSSRQLVHHTPLELGTQHFERMFTSLHMSCVTCHMSCVICHRSHVTCHMSPVTWHFNKVVEPVNGGSVINRVYPV